MSSPTTSPEAAAAYDGFLEALKPMKVVLPSSVVIGMAGWPVYTTIQRWRMKYGNKMSLVELFKHVKRTEGWAGLFKGSVLLLAQLGTTVATGSIYQLVIARYMLPSNFLAYFKARPALSAIVAGAAINLVTLPLQIVNARLLASSRRFPAFSPLANIRALFTRQERTNPVKTLFTPSNIAVVLLPEVISGIGLLGLTRLAASYPIEQRWLVKIVGQMALSILIAVPFDVLELKLFARPAQTAAIDEKDTQSFGETSVELRPQHYMGLADCAEKVVQEEGWSTLFRAWYTDVVLVVALAYFNKYTDALDTATNEVIRTSGKKDL